MTAPEALSPEEFSALMAELGLRPDMKLAVAVSGGADSMALLRLSHDWGADMTALTYDHGLRAASHDEAAQVGRWCAEIGVPHHILTWQGDHPSSDIQQAARNARYHDLESWCAQNGCAHLLLAHHQDDQAETVLMRLIRGSGVNGLAAMKKSSPALTLSEGLRLERPLLDVPKARLQATLKDMGQDWLDDPSNSDERFLRARVREIMQRFEADGLSPSRLAFTADRMGRVRDYFDDVIAGWLQTHAVLDEAGFVTLQLDVLRHEHPELRSRLISRLLQAVSGHRHPPSFDGVMRVDEALEGEFAGMTSFGCRLWAEGAKLFVAREAAPVEEGALLEKGSAIHWDGRFHISLQGGEGRLRVSALGEEGWIELLERFPDAREAPMPHPVRLSLPALRKDGKIVAVPHLGYDLSDGGTLVCRFEPKRALF